MVWWNLSLPVVSFPLLAAWCACGELRSLSRRSVSRVFTRFYAGVFGGKPSTVPQRVKIEALWHCDFAAFGALFIRAGGMTSLSRETLGKQLAGPAGAMRSRMKIKNQLPPSMAAPRSLLLQQLACCHIPVTQCCIKNNKQTKNDKPTTTCCIWRLASMKV